MSYYAFNNEYFNSQEAGYGHVSGFVQQQQHPCSLSNSTWEQYHQHEAEFHNVNWGYSQEGSCPQEVAWVPHSFYNSEMNSEHTRYSLVDLKKTSTAALNPEAKEFNYNMLQDGIKSALQIASLNPEAKKFVPKELQTAATSTSPIIRSPQPANHTNQQQHSTFAAQPQPYTIQLPANANQVVATTLEFSGCLAHLTKASIVGIDGEWRPSNNFADARMAVLQLATPDFVFLLDVPALKMVLDNFQWKCFVDRVLCNGNILKVGFALENDWKILEGVNDCFQNIGIKVSNVCDLKVVCDRAVKVGVPIFEGLKEGHSYFGRRSLAAYTELALGVFIDKTCQVSDWEQRPLSEAQLDYAVKDAYVLLDVYKAVIEGCLRLKLPSSFLE